MAFMSKRNEDNISCDLYKLGIFCPAEIAHWIYAGQSNCIIEKKIHLYFWKIVCFRNNLR